MLRLDVDFNKYKDVFSMSIAEENKLYRKFGVPEFYENRERFVLALSLTNNIVPYETLKKVCEKYSLKGYDKMLEDIKKRNFGRGWSAFVGSGKTAETKHEMPFNAKITRHAPKHLINTLKKPTRH